jgi:hypothetical protein
MNLPDLSDCETEHLRDLAKTPQFFSPCLDKILFIDYSNSYRSYYSRRRQNEEVG